MIREEKWKEGKRKLYEKKTFGNILLTKTTAGLNEVALSNLRVRGIYFLAVALAVTIDSFQPLFSAISTTLTFFIGDGVKLSEKCPCQIYSVLVLLTVYACFLIWMSLCKLYYIVLRYRVLRNFKLQLRIPMDPLFP